MYQPPPHLGEEAGMAKVNDIRHKYYGDVAHPNTSVDPRGPGLLRRCWAKLRRRTP
jgi:hypothetical protein